MIEGLHFDFKTEDLMTLLIERAKYHATRAEFYEEEAKRYGSQPDFDTASNNSSLVSIRDKAGRHRGQATKFTLLADRLVPRETYRLTDHDLQRLDLIT